MSTYQITAFHVCARYSRESAVLSDFEEGPEGTGMYHPHEVFHADLRKKNTYDLH